MKKSFRLFSIVIAIGLLVGAFGIGSVLAKQVDLGNLGVLDSSSAPMAVSVLEDDVEWSTSSADDTDFLKADVFGNFYVQDDALETTLSGTATWGNLETSIPAGDDFRIKDGWVAVGGGAFTAIATSTVTTEKNYFLLDAASYDSSTTTNTPLVDRPTVTVGTSQPLVQNFSPAAGTFDLITATDARSASNTVAAFDFHLQDRYDGSDTEFERAKVFSTSDPAGEIVQIWEVSDFNASTAVTGETPLLGLDTSGATTSITTLVVPIVDTDGDGDLDNIDITVSVNGIDLGEEGSVFQDFQIDTVNVNTGVITFKDATTEVALPAGSITVAYSVATRDAESQLFRGQVLLSSNAESRGTNDDGIWVQDADMLTVQYLDDDGVVVDTDTIAIDALAPSVTDISPADEGITNESSPVISFDVTDTGSGISTLDAPTAITITINTVPVSSGDPSFQGITNGLRAFFSQGTDWEATSGGFRITDGELFNWEISASDAAGNTTFLTGADALRLTIDTVAPLLVEAITGRAWDPNLAAEDTDEVNTSVRAEFGEPLDPDSVSASDFEVDGVAPSAVIVGTDGSDIYVYLAVAALGPDTTPAVTVVGTVTDLAGNELDFDPDGSGFEVEAALDGLSPTQTARVSLALGVEGDVVTVKVDTDEKLASSGGLLISVQGSAGAVDNGLLDSTSPAPEEFEAELTISAGSATGIYGITVQSTDLGANAIDNMVVVEDEDVSGNDANGDARIVIDSSSVTLSLSLDTGPIADRNLDGDLDGDDVSVRLNGSAVATNRVSVVNASLHTIVLATTTPFTAAASSAVVSYNYISVSDDDPKHWFEIDQSTPTVTFDPADGDEVQNESPFIRVIFDDDEYVGDTFTTVDLTQADVTWPSGTVTDELLSFVADEDGSTWIWAATGLPLGDYTIVASGVDVAGNEVLEETATFSIIARDPYEVSIRPGWNLVSMPGAPADGDINAVITNPKIDAVLAYDPTQVSPWRTATRNSAGAWTGNLTTVNANTGYWVHGETFDAIAVDIPALTAGAAILPPSFAVNQGWNLVGVSVIDIKTLDVDADEYFASIDWARAYTFDTAGNKFISLLPETSTTASSDVVTVGKGYFVYANEPGTVVP